MSEPRLILFDVDGTLIDSQGHIIAAMRAAFARFGMQAPSDDAVRAIVGLSLPVAIARLAPDADSARVEAMTEAYKDAFTSVRQTGRVEDLAPLFPGARDLLEQLGRCDWTLLGVATGKSRRGLDHVFAAHGIAPHFITVQVADDHPSKPNPSMIEKAMAETGVDAARTVIVGDTSFDMEMGRAAGVQAIGVSWGYHPVQALRLAGADCVVDDFAALGRAIGSVEALQ